MKTDIIFDPKKVQRIITYIAAMQNEVIGSDADKAPVLETLLPGYNFRLEAVCSDWLEIPQFTIRRPQPEVIPLSKWLEEDKISQENYDILLEYIRNKKNIVISGATSSGKTTFLNSCIDEVVNIWPDDRFLIIEDQPELICKAENSACFRIKKYQAARAMEVAMRWSMKRLIFGEIRSSIILKELLEIWLSGHPGNFTTIHAESAEMTLERMKGLLSAPEYQDAKNKINKTIHLIVHLTNKEVDEVIPVSAFTNLSKTIEEYENQRLHEGVFNDVMQKLAANNIEGAAM